MAGRRYTTVVGVFRDRADAERAVHELRRAGFRGGQVRLVARDEAAPKTARPKAKKKRSNRTAPPAAAGPAAEGAVSGGAIGGLVGAAAVAAGVIPVVGPALAAGIVAGAVGTAAGATTGGLLGGLAETGTGEAETAAYESQLAAGSVLVTVRALTRHLAAAAVLRRCGGDVA